MCVSTRGLAHIHLRFGLAKAATCDVSGYPLIPVTNTSSTMTTSPMGSTTRHGRSVDKVGLNTIIRRLLGNRLSGNLGEV